MHIETLACFAAALSLGTACSSDTSPGDSSPGRTDGPVVTAHDGKSGADDGESGVDRQGTKDSQGADFGDGAVTQERYDTCIQAKDQASCLAAGGEWRVIAGAVVEGCHCPTGQGNKRCTSPADCLSECLADPNDGVMNCDGIVEGRCSDSSIVVGCHCYFDEEGRVSGKCLS